MKNLRNFVILAGLLALGLALTACGGDSNGGGGPPVSKPVPQAPSAPVVSAGNQLLTVRWTALHWHGAGTAKSAGKNSNRNCDGIYRTLQ